jgi:hypothetical protein
LFVRVCFWKTPSSSIAGKRSSCYINMAYLIERNFETPGFQRPLINTLKAFAGERFQCIIFLRTPMHWIERANLLPVRTLIILLKTKCCERHYNHQSIYNANTSQILNATDYMLWSTNIVLHLLREPKQNHSNKSSPWNSWLPNRLCCWITFAIACYTKITEHDCIEITLQRNGWLKQ